MSDVTPPSLLHDNRLFWAIFLAFRLMIGLVYQPQIVNGVGKGLSASGDYAVYYRYAALSTAGKLPYRDYWYEFPPVFPILSLAVYSVANWRGSATFEAYAALLGLLMTLFDAASLWLVRNIGRQLYGDEMGSALGWLVALLAAPLIVSWWTFEPIVLFAVLLTVYAFITRRDNYSALSIVFGALTKLYPVLLIGLAFRFRSLREALRDSAIAIGLTLVGLVGVVAVAGSFGWPSLTAQFDKASYETIWAVIDRNYRTGLFGAVEDHFDPAKANDLRGNPPVIPIWLRTFGFGLLALFVFVRVRRFDAQGSVAFTAISLTLFFLWSQGWSPQWQIVLIPLILLCFPNRIGVYVCLALSLISFIEYPTLFLQGVETNLAVAASQVPLFVALVMARTALLAGLAVALHQKLRQPAALIE